jgi:EAL domain-containing protein (putative c-di-GMP-specific phosphodiesterase class I)
MVEIISSPQSVFAGINSTPTAPINLPTVKKLLAQLDASEARIERIVEFAHRLLSLDAAYLSEFRGDQRLYRAVAGDAASFNIAATHSLPVVATLDQRMVTGAIPNIIRDTSADERVADLFVTRYAGIGAYVGVPIRLSDGTLYGALACVSHEPEHALRGRAVLVLSMLAELIIDDVEEERGREDLRESIASLIERGELDVAYQPVFELAGDRCVGLEALARFPKPFGPPAQTFAAAHAVGLGVELERAAMRRALEILPRLGPGQFVSVNASPAALLEVARRAGQVENVPWARIVVEITEHSAIEAYAVLQQELTPLRRRGLRIAVDDVGAGYASLRHVLELRPDFIKLDHWLTDGVAEDGDRRAAISAFVALAGQLGSTVIGEGVERPEDLEALRELGLDAAQGFLLGGPASDPETVLRWCSEAAPSVRKKRTVPPAATATGEAGQRTALDEDRKRLELDRRISHRLEAVGQLSAGIAHEINTPLQFVGDSVTFLQDAVDELLRLTWLYRETLNGDAPIPVEERRRIMREAEERAEVDYLCERIPLAFARTTDGIARVRSIVQAMKRFSHASSNESAPADINEAIETTLAVCRNEYKYVANVSLALGELPPVNCNIGELNQVFLNLIINSAQALDEKVSESGQLGVISISTQVDGSDVEIVIADDGPGIPRELQERIYEPFFTTKQVGQGTGQGLALALATIDGHGGSLKCASEPGQGATFTIRLPLERPTPAIVRAA